LNFKTFSLTLFLAICSIAQAVAQEGNLSITKVHTYHTNAVINTLKYGPDSMLYAATNHGLDKIDVTSHLSTTLIPQRSTDITFVNASAFYITDGKKIMHYPSLKEVSLSNTTANISSICYFNKRLYIGTNQGLWAYNDATTRMETFNTKNSHLKSDVVNIIYADTKGKLWIGTSKGEVRMHEDKWKTYHENKNVVNVYENKEGLWFVSKDGNKQTMWLVDHYNREYDAGLGPDLYTGELNDFAIDSKGKLYLASDSYMRYDPYSDKIQNFTENTGVLTKQCSTTAMDANDNVWIGTAGDGLFKLQFDERASASLAVACLASNHPTCDNKNNGAIEVVVSGGSKPYHYMWNDADVLGAKPNNVRKGLYTVTVTDSKSNTQSCTVTLQSPELLFVSSTKIQGIKTFNGKEGAIEVSAMGGAGNYTYAWSNGSNKATINNLVAGVYTVTVTDKNSCTALGEYKLTREKILKELDISKIAVGKEIRLEELSFKADSSVIENQSYDVLGELLLFLESNPNVVIEIGGHTNTIPSHEYCDKLSTDRAKNVAQFFYKNGIPSTRLTYKGYGKRKPLTNDNSLQGRQRNQRVEVRILGV
jgi:outer membrane protein OmpA-like peptidoglycan-associated protein